MTKIVKRGLPLVFSAAVAFANCGCAVLPSFNAPIGPSDAAPTVDDLVAHIQCEILVLQNETDIKLTDDQKNLIPKLKNEAYIVYASLTLDVSDSQGLSPSLNFINPYAVAMTNITQALGGQLSDTQHRNIVQTFTLDLSRTQGTCKADRKTTDKTHEETTFGLTGDLGLEEIILAGLQHADDQSFIFGIPASDQAGKAHISGANVPTFGSTIDFTLVYGVNGGPTWTLKHFKGPGGASSGLVNLMRTEKDTLVISFAPSNLTTEASVAAPPTPTTVPPPPVSRQPPSARKLTPYEFQFQTLQSLQDATQALKDATRQLQQRAAPTGPSDKDAAAAAARNGATQMILQNLLNSGVVPQP